MADDDEVGTRSSERADAGKDTPFEKPGGPPQKPGGRGRLPVGALAAILFIVLIVIAVVLAVVASGGSGNGQTTSMAPLVIAVLDSSA